MKNKKIAQLVCTFPPYKGGIGNAALQFSTLLQTKGREVSTYTPNYKNKKNVIQNLSENNKTVKVHYLSPLLQYGNAALLPQVFSIARNHDILYLHYPFFGTDILVWITKIIWRKKKKLILHYHMDVRGLNFIGKIFQLPSKLILPSLLKRSDVITCASLDYIQNSDIKKIYYRYPEKFQEIPFGVDVTEFYSSPTYNKKTPTILFVGGLDRAHYFKGVEYFIDALHLLEEKMPKEPWQVHIVGEGELKNYYQEKVKEKGMSHRIKFLGGLKKQELSEEYRNSDIFVLPSINKGEAFGMVLLEAMACGTPVIASDLAGVRSVFNDQVEGLTAKPKDKKDLAQKIGSLLQNPQKRREMGEKAEKLVQEHYTFEKMGDRLEQALNKII